MCRNLAGHAHWINSLALNVDYALRTGQFDLSSNRISTNDEEAKEFARKRYEATKQGESEKLVSGSDDFTMFFWEPEQKKQPITRMTGHQQLINQVMNFYLNLRLPFILL